MTQVFRSEKARVAARCKILIQEYRSLLPSGVCFEDGAWNLISWTRKRGNSSVNNVRWTTLKNVELRILAKLYALDRRGAARFKANSIITLCANLCWLDREIGSIGIHQLTTAHFLATERALPRPILVSTHRCATMLDEFGRWLHRKVGLRIRYKCSIPSPAPWGRYGTEEARAKKLIPIEALAQLLAVRSRSDISERDRFFVNSIALLPAAGLRIGELVTLPKDCIIDDGPEGFGIRYFPEKKNVPKPRWIPTSYVPVVRQAIKEIREFTEPGRLLAENLTPQTEWDWHAIYANDEALNYFTRRFIHDWCRRKENQLSPNGAVWLSRRRTYVDVVKVLKAHAGDMKAAAASIGLSYERFRDRVIERSKPRRLLQFPHHDPRVVSAKKFYDHTGLYPSKRVSRLVTALTIKGYCSQIAGIIPPAPKRSRELEGRYRRVHVALYDQDGKPLLLAKDALFVMAKHALAPKFPTKSNTYSLITAGMIVKWFRGEYFDPKRKYVEQSCWEKFGILDPQTGKPYEFTPHDIRRWFNTIWQQGGLTDQQIAILLGKTTTAQNAVYDQTPFRDRIGRLRQAVREGHAVGALATEYRRISELSSEEAEDYLLACTFMAGLMPHGACSHPLHESPCPHNLGCFVHNGNADRICEMLAIDADDPKQISEITVINRNAASMRKILPSDSPQRGYYNHVYKNTDRILKRDIPVARGRMPPAEPWRSKIGDEN